MEDGLVLLVARHPQTSQWCLNPYCNGRWSRTIRRLVSLLKVLPSLNPYCNGRWSRTSFIKMEYMKDRVVLILIVMEDGLVPDAKSPRRR